MEKFNALTLFSASLGLAVLLSYISISVSRKYGLLDLPRSEKHKVHRSPVPIAGGSAFFLSLILLAIIFRGAWLEINILEFWVIFGILIVFFAGIFDDIFSFSAKLKLAGQILGSLFIVFGGWSSSIFSSPVLNTIISLFWFVGIINAFNFLDGSDGLILQTGIVTSLAVLIFAGMSDQPSLQSFAFSLIGIQLGLLIFNFRPAKMFMGDGGSQVLGLILAMIVIRYNPVGYQKATSWITPILMMSLPIFDVTLVVVSRLRRQVPVTLGNLDHTYHRLVQLGFKPSIATLTLLLAVIASNIIAHLTLIAQRNTAFIIFGFTIALGILLIFWLEVKFIESD